ncbi:MAG: hypothetical protein V4574_11685 [Pseudomonadota bacterium]
MRRFALSLALAAMPVLAATPAPAAPVIAAGPPIECIYNVLHKNDWPTLVKVVRQGITGVTNGEKMQVELIGSATERCRKQYGWGKKRQDIAVRYFAGRVLSGDAVFNLKKYAIDHAQLEALVARLDAPTKQAYVAGQVSNEQSAATFAALDALGLGLDKVPAEERQAFAQKLAQGVLGTIVAQEAEAAFAAA